MLKLKYLKCKTSYEVDFFYISENIIELQGTFPIKSSGFILSRLDFDDEWDYSDFKTVYRTLENGVQFSNDESVYVEPEPTPDLPDVSSKPYEPTPEELEAIFQKNKNNKILHSKSMLAEFLENNPVKSTAYGGIEGIYSATNEKQTLMMSQYMTYQIEKAVNKNAKLRWNETGKSCKEWTEEEFLQLIIEIKTYVYPLVSYQQHIEENIYKCTSQEELDNIIIDYISVTTTLIE